MSDTGSTGASGKWGAAIGGGVIGAVLTAGLLLLGAPRLAGERIVREALTAHPELLVAASDALRDKQYAPTLAAQRSSLETPYHSSWKGSAKPDVTLTYFYDYACGYCRKSNPDLERLVAEDKGLRIVYRELPILGPDSVAAARVALAASQAGRFSIYHDALYQLGRPSRETIAQAAAVAGVGAAQPSPAAEAELKKNFAIAGQLGATGTPLFIVGDKVFNSAVGYDALKDAIAAARKG